MIEVQTSGWDGFVGVSLNNRDVLTTNEKAGNLYRGDTCLK